MKESQIIPTSKRIEVLDIVRGFAVFGIFMVNVEIMNCTFINQDAFSAQWTSTLDILSVRFLQLFFYSKFFPIFSFLFGLGIAMQALKAYEKNTYSRWFFIRRMFGLFVIGWLHIILFWSGDVIHLYALLGLLTASILKISNKFLLVCSALFLLFPYYDSIFEWLFNLIDFSPQLALSDYTSGEIVEVIRNGTYIDGVRLRLSEYVANIPLLFSYLAPVAFSMFLLGLYFGKKRFIYSLDSVVHRMKWPIILITVLTNAFRILFLFVLPQYEIYSEYRAILGKMMFVSDVFMGLFYLWLIAYLVRFKFWNFLLSPLKYVGRMALTNYIMQSIIGLFLFSSVGFSLYETLSPFQTILVAVIVFLFQVFYSRAWLKYFKFGPLEWIWRCLSYKKLLPFKKNN